MYFLMHRVWRAFILLTVLLVCLAAWGIHIYWEREQDFRHQVETSVKTTSELTIRSLVEWRSRLYASANAISDDALLGQALVHWRTMPSAITEAPIADRLRSLVERGGFTKAVLLTRHADVLLASGGGTSQLQEREQAALSQALETAQAVFVEPYSNSNFAYPSVSVLAPLFVGNECVGVMWLIVDLRATLFPLLDMWRAASVSSENLLMQREGDVLIHVNPLRHNDAAALSKFADISDVHLVAVQAFHGRRGVIYDRDYRNHQVLAVAGVVPDSPWMLVTKRDVTDAFSDQQRKDGLLLGLSIGLVMLAFGAMGFYMIWGLVRQERHLKTELERNMRWLDRAQKTASLGIFSIDLKDREATLSSMAANILGYPEKITIPVKQLKSMFHKDDADKFMRQNWKSMDTHASFQTSFRVFPKNGVRPKWIEVWGEWDVINQNKKLIGTIQDISLRRKVEEELESYRRSLEEQVRTDPLTGLANRFALNEAMNSEWLRARRNNQPLSLLMIDLDYFKGYNDFYGHLEGDECLKSVGRKIMATVSRTEDLVARYGGEEFAILLPNTGEENARLIAERLCKAVEKMQIEHLASPAYKVVTISVGVSSISPIFGQPQLEQDASMRQLFDQADNALYQAKNAGRNCYRVFKERVQPRSQSISY
jgi:diguanylate cyclase (GGDEF)-like protein